MVPCRASPSSVPEASDGKIHSRQSVTVLARLTLYQVDGAVSSTVRTESPIELVGTESPMELARTECPLDALGLMRHLSMGFYRVAVRGAQGSAPKEGYGQARHTKGKELVEEVTEHLRRPPTMRELCEVDGQVGRDKYFIAQISDLLGLRLRA
ncbi:hypothetical protein BHE74_00029215 [Ensete ventricosum]|nr:hypothetical protein GW17_00036867 [Ensete ventricosum]RWW63584.1 hypothetical protein BHE74_00029215 [Ensete ventricosum]RZR85270.1 hypothetical protein BHM03_00012225 [Ensete ventricosum]